MSAVLPPAPVRRAASPLFLPLVVLLTALLIPVAIVGGVIALFPGKQKLWRAACFAIVYLWMDLGILVSCWVLWLRWPLPSRDVASWRAAHCQVLNRGLVLLGTAARSWLGFHVVIEDSAVPTDRHPLIVLARHAGPGDSFTLVNRLITSFDRRPKVVLKAALQWDPGIDILLNRLDCYFLPSHTGAGDDRIAAVRKLAESLTEDEALLIFPEGGNWTPKRYERALRKLRRQGEDAQAKLVEQRANVLPPRPGGVVACLTARPECDVVIIAHAGLDKVVTPGEIWAAIPVNEHPMTIHWWVTDAADVPTEAPEIVRWLDAEWGVVDEWVEQIERHPGVVPDVLPEDRLAEQLDAVPPVPPEAG